MLRAPSSILPALLWSGLWAGLRAGLWVVALASISAACEASTSGPVIHGRVLDADSRETVPLAGARVELTPLVGRWQLGDYFFQGKTGPESVRHAVTGDDGTFTVQAPDAGMWRVTVEADGRVPVQSTLVPLYRDLELPDVSLERDDGLTVRVVDSAGRPLETAAVLAFGSGSAVARRGRNGLPLPTWSRATELAFTSADGRVRLRGRRGEELRLQVAEPEHPSKSTEVRLATPGELEITLDRGRRVTLRARDEAEAPIADAFVWFHQQPFPVGWTGQDGLTSVVLPRRGAVRLLGLAESGARAAFELNTSSPVESLRMPFREPESIEGRVLRHGSQDPVPDALVWSWYLPDRFVRTDGRGWFRVPTDRAGAYVSAVREGYRPSGVHRQSDDDAPSVIQLRAVGSLAGVVVDVQGEPVAGLGLRSRSRDVSWSGDKAWLARSDDDGTFFLQDLPAEEELSIVLGGEDARGTLWAEVVRDIDPLAPGELREGLVLRAERGLAAVGRVLNESEQPVAAASVRLIDVDPRRRALRLPPRSARETRSDDVGDWTIEALQPGVYDLEVWARGYAKAVVPRLEVGVASEFASSDDAGSDDLGSAPELVYLEPVDLGTVLLGPGVDLAGRVIDEDHRPVAGAEIRGGEAPEPVVTDDVGRFLLRDLRGGAQVRVTARHPDYLEGSAGPMTVPSVGTDTVVNELEIVLRRGTSVIGRVTDEAGWPVAEAAVALFAQGGGGAARGGQSTATTDREGAFVLRQVPDGPSTLQVSHRDFPRHSEPLRVLPAHSGATRVEVVLSAVGGSLRGTVHDLAGDPVAAALVLLPGDGVLRSASTHTDAEGDFEILRVDPGRRELVVHHAAFASYRTELDVTSNTWVDVELDRGVSVSGVVVDQVGAPLAGARIDSSPLDVAGQATREGAVSAADGSWTIERLVPGRYRLRARAEGYYPPALEEPVVLDGNLTGVRLEMHRGVALEGRVVGADFDELTDLSIVARTMNADVHGSAPTLWTKVDFEGGFRLEGLSPGTWRVSVGLMSLGGPSSADVVVEAGRNPEPVVLRLGEGHAVRGTLRIYGEPPGWSAGTLRVMLRRSGGGPDASMRFFERGGGFEFDDVPPGVYEMSVLSSSGRLWHQQIEVEGEVNLEIEARVASLAGTVRDESGRPLGDVWLLANSSESGGVPDEKTITATTGDDGRFRIEVLPVGDYTLHLARNGFRFEAQQLSLVEGLSLDLELVMHASDSSSPDSTEH